MHATHLIRWRQRVWLAVPLLALRFSAVAQTPGVEIIYLPPCGSTNWVEGRVTNVNPADYRVAVFIYVPCGWWIKPWCNVLTVIQPDGTWTTDIATVSGSDSDAAKVAALLVSTNFTVPCDHGLSVLPTNAVARVVALRDAPCLRQFEFSGYEWWVKACPSKAGPGWPGGNWFSDSTENVWLDEQGRLHLKITHRSNEWQCAEVVTARTFGYGSYRLQLDSRVDSFNTNVVLGLFTWSDDPAYANREIDIEWWSRLTNDVVDGNNLQFVVQPWDFLGHRLRFAMTNELTNSTHFFTWESNRVSFQSQAGAFCPNPDPTNVIRQWSYTLEVPQTGDENVRLNLWLYSGWAPTDGREVEVVIKSFEFVPLGPPAPAQFLTALRLPDGTVKAVIQGEMDCRYEVQTCPNLSAWQPLATLLGTNSVFELVDTSAPSVQQRYYRIVTLP